MQTPGLEGESQSGGFCILSYYQEFVFFKFLILFGRPLIVARWTGRGGWGQTLYNNFEIFADGLWNYF
jgi:hypothetical protein